MFKVINKNEIELKLQECDCQIKLDSDNKITLKSVKLLN